MYIAVALPMLLATVLAVGVGRSVGAALMGVVGGAAVGVTLCAFIGIGMARHWPFPSDKLFAAGLAISCAWTAVGVLLSGQVGPNYLGGLAYLLAGVALSIGFVRARPRTPISSETEQPA